MNVLVTLTAPSAAGKSYLYNFIRQMELPCIISTTTRKPRPGEVEGVDYYFISHEESLQHEANDNFAELVTYNGFRYGVTRDEYLKKLNMCLAFLIVEPLGINSYTKVAKESGAEHLSVFIDVDFETRIKRLNDRFLEDLNKVKHDEEAFKNVFKNNFNRLILACTSELTWKDSNTWDLVLDGTDDPNTNLMKISDAVDALRIKLKPDVYGIDD